MPQKINPLTGQFDLVNDPQTAVAIGKNLFINGNLNIWQRGDTFVAPANLDYTADRWQWTNSNASLVVDINKSTQVPNASVISSLEIDITTASGSPEVGDIVLLGQKGEGFNAIELEYGTATAKTAALTFWIRAPITGTYCIAVRNATGTRSYVAEYNVAVADTWEFKTIIIPGEPTGTWDKSDGTGIDFTFCFMADTTFGDGTNETWHDENKLATANQVNGVNDTADFIYIAQVQIEVGDTATDFEHKSHGAELALCQRYLPAFNSQDTFNSVGGGSGMNSTSGGYIQYTHKVPSRVPPTGITVSNVAHFTLLAPSTVSAVTNAISWNQASADVTRLFCTVATTPFTAGDPVEMYANNVLGQILFTGCEL